MSSFKPFNTTFLSFLIITLNIILISCSNTRSLKVLLENNIIEVQAKPDFFTEVKNCIKSLNEGTFIHYDYSEEEEEHQNENDNEEGEEEEEEEVEIEDTNDDIIEERQTTDTYSIEKDLEELKELEKKLENFKEGEINEDELKFTKLKLDSIMNKYKKNEINDKIEKTDIDIDNQNYNNEEFIDEDNQNSMLRSYVTEILEETNDIDSTAFDVYLKESVKKLNLLTLFTMETEVKIILAANF
jgi:hypothetical protein